MGRPDAPDAYHTDMYRFRDCGAVSHLFDRPLAACAGNSDDNSGTQLHASGVLGVAKANRRHVLAAAEGLSDRPDRHARSHPRRAPGGPVADRSALRGPDLIGPFLPRHSIEKLARELPVIVMARALGSRAVDVIKNRRRLRRPARRRAPATQPCRSAYNRPPELAPAGRRQRANLPASRSS